MTELATAAHLSVSTIKRIETSGTQAVSDTACSAVREAFEAAGVTFLDDDGASVGIRLSAR